MSSNVLVYGSHHDEAVLRRMIREHSNDRLLQEEVLLTEGLISSDLVKDVVQYVMGSATEWGIGAAGGAITLPVGAEGAAAGPVVETIVDTLFGAEAVKATIDTISNAKEMAGEYTTLISDAWNAYDPGDFKGFYGKLKLLVQKLLQTFGKAAKKIDEVVEEIKEVLQKMISAVVRPIEKAIQFVIPESTIGLAAAKAAGQILQALAENAYTGITSVIKQFDWLQRFVENPSVAQDFFRSVTEQIISLMRDAADYIEKSNMLDSWWKKGMLAAVSPPALLAGLFAKGYGPSMFRKAADALEGFMPTMLKLLDQILNVVMPYMFTCLALFQIFMKGDHKAKEEGDAEIAPPVKLAASYNRRGNIQITEQRLRSLIRNSLVLKEAHQTIIQSPYEDVDDYNVLANYALTGDIAGALADPALKPYVDKNEMGWVADEAIGWFNRVGEEGWEMPAPEGWDSKKAHKFLRDIEDAAYNEYSKAMKARISSDPDTAWLRFLGNAFTAGIEPDDMEDIKWKQYKKYIRIKPPRSISHGVGEISVNRDEVEGYSDSPGTYEDFIEFLERRAGGQLGRRAPYKRSPAPYYD